MYNLLRPLLHFYRFLFITARVRSTREGNVLTRVCPSIHPSVCPQGGGGVRSSRGGRGGSGPAGGEGWVSRGGGGGQLGGGVGQPGGGVGQPGGRGGSAGGRGGSAGGRVGQPGGRGGSAGRGGGGGGVGQPGGRGGSAGGGEGWVSMAGGMPLAFTQEDFLVMYIFMSNLVVRTCYNIFIYLVF